MGRVFQGASTVDAILRSDLIERAAEAGMRSVFVGLETVNPANLALHAKRQNVARDYGEVIRKVHGLGIMINASFVFGLDDDGPDVFDRTVDWGVAQSIETATFHIMTPYPGTALHARVADEGRITDHDWEHYDTRHVVYRPLRMTPDQLLSRLSPGLSRLLSLGRDRRGAPRASRRCSSRCAISPTQAAGRSSSRSGTSSSGRKRVNAMLPLLEGTLDAYGRARKRSRDRAAVAAAERDAA